MRSLHSKRIASFESSLENLWVSVQIRSAGRSQDLLICVVYLPPPVTQDALNIVISNIDAVMNSYSGKTIVLGDFNVGFIDWVNKDDSNKLYPENYNNMLGYSFIDFLSRNDISQFNCIKNNNNRILDLVLSNLGQISVHKSLSALCIEDGHHPALEISAQIDKSIALPEKVFATHNFRKANYMEIRDKIRAVDWSTELSGDDVNLMVARFYEILNKIIDSYVPKTKTRNTKHPVWFTKILISLIKEKEKTRLKYRKYRNPRDLIELKILTKRVDSLMRKCYQEYIYSIENSLKANPKKFWSYVKATRGRQSHIPADINLSNKTANNVHGVCNLFAEHFSSVYSQKTSNIFVNTVDLFPQLSLHNISIRERNIANILKRLDPNKGAGPDGIPPYFIKMTYKVLTLPLKIIYEKSLEKSCFPDIWKEANVVPIHKKGNQNDVKNYRPVSLLNIFSKTFECLISLVLSSYAKNLIKIEQHGFCKNKSTVSNLVNYVNNLSKSVDAKIQVDAVYTDFSSAFDKVDHNILIAKLKRYGIHGPLLLWFQSYLENRVLRVVVQGYRSSPFVASSGVPQGSHLGPILFLLFINDITECVHYSKCSLFADDLKLYKNITNQDDVKLLQDDLYSIHKWCLENNMTLNVSKCFHIKFTKKRNVTPSAYYIGSEVIHEVSSIRDLGVKIDSKLKLTDHINVIVSKAWRLLGFLKRMCHDFKNISSIISLYNSLVRSCLEFSSPVWNPCYKVHINRLERIQRNFTKYLAYKDRSCPYRSDYETRLKHFKMDSLEHRRKIMDILMLHKVANGTLITEDLLNEININVPRKIPRYPIRKTFNKMTLRTKIHSPLNSLKTIYNEIASDMDLFQYSFGAFKKVLKEYFRGK